MPIDGSARPVSPWPPQALLFPLLAGGDSRVSQFFPYLSNYLAAASTNNRCSWECQALSVACSSLYLAAQRQPQPSLVPLGSCAGAAVVQGRQSRFFEAVQPRDNSPTNCFSSLFSRLSCSISCRVASRTLSRVNLSFPASMNSLVHA